MGDAKVATTYARSIILGSIAGFADVDSGKTKELSGVKVVDPQRSEITLSAPNSSFLPVLNHGAGRDYPKEAADNAETFAAKPCRDERVQVRRVETAGADHAGREPGLLARQAAGRYGDDASHPGEV